MTVFVKSHNHMILAVKAHPTLTSLSGWDVVSSGTVNSVTGTIRVENNYIDYDDFVAYFKAFTIYAGVIKFATGVTAANFKTKGKVSALDTTVPLSFTRANTVVNFGRL